MIVNSQNRNIEEIFIEITNHCLQSCIHCSSKATRTNYSEITLASLKKIVMDTKLHGLKNVVLSGGEPFLHPDFFRFVNFLQGERLRYSVYTCGVVFCNGVMSPIPAAYFNQIKSEYLNTVIFSLHAGCSETQMKISGFSKSFDYVLESIQAATLHQIPVEIHVVPMRINFDEIYKVLEIANALEVGRVSFLRFVSQGRGTEELNLNKEQLVELQQLYRTYKNSYKNVKIRFGTPFNCITYSGNHCTAGVNKLLINAHGDILPCEAFKYLQGQRPTIYDNSIYDVWQNDILLQALREIDVDHSSICYSCQYKDGCHGGCPGQRLHLYGSFEKEVDPSCLFR